AVAQGHAAIDRGVAAIEGCLEGSLVGEGSRAPGSGQGAAVLVGQGGAGLVVQGDAIGQVEESWAWGTRRGETRGTKSPGQPTIPSGSGQPRLGALLVRCWCARSAAAGPLGGASP